MIKNSKLIKLRLLQANFLPLQIAFHKILKEKFQLNILPKGMY